ncbi:MAG: hypothetical protein HOV81_03490 [Kofleriaceae bacterium]|nr:hypothetical protein [Kofleriaceae bacterium]
MSGCRQDTSRTQDNATPTENTAGTPRDPTVIPDDALRGDAQVPKPERSSRRPSLQRRSTVVKDKESMAQAEPEVPGEGSQFEPPTFTPPSQITPPAETTLPQDNITPPSEVVPPAEPITPQNAPTPTPTPTPNLPPGTQTFGSGVSPGVSAPNPVRPPLTTPQTTPGTTVQPTPGTAAPGTPQTTPPATPPVAPQPAPQTPPMGTTPQPFTPGPG